MIALLSQLEDPRETGKVQHPLSTIFFMSICAIFCGAETWEEIVCWADKHQNWLSHYVDMSHGVPSYSTIRRMFMLVSPDYWEKLIRQTMAELGPAKKSEDHIAIDGKTLRGSVCKSKEIRAMQMVSAWSVENNIILGEVKTDSHSNEIKAIPLLLELLSLEGATLSLDAIGCQKKIIQAILKQGAHYVIGLKKNQRKLYQAVESYAQKEGTELSHLIRDHFDDSHGRSVRRRYFSFEIPEEIKSLGFEKMKTVVATETISSSRYTKGVKSQWRYYITDHEPSQIKLADYIRDHWQVESMHWCLDVHLNDDHDKKYEKNAAENFAKTKRLFFNLVRSNLPQGKKRSLRSHLKMVGWDMDYLEKLLLLV